MSRARAVAVLSPAGAVVLRGVPQPPVSRALLRPAIVAHTPVAGPKSGPDASLWMVHEAKSALEDAAKELHAAAAQKAAAEQTQAVEQAYREGLEAGREEVRQSGFEKGLQQGLVQGREAGAIEVQREKETLHAAMARQSGLLDQLVQSLKTQTAQHLMQRLETAEDEMVSLCHAAIGRLLGEHALDAEIIIGAVRRAMGECCGDTLESLLSVHVHPDDLALLQADAGLARWLADKDGGRVVWRADGEVTLGGCVVRSTHGSLDARLETQLEALTEAFRQRRGEGRIA